MNSSLPSITLFRKSGRESKPDTKEDDFLGTKNFKEVMFQKLDDVRRHQSKEINKKMNNLSKYSIRADRMLFKANQFIADDYNQRQHEFLMGMNYALDRNYT